MTEQQLNDVWTYDQSEQTPTAVIKDGEGFDVGYVRGTGLDPRESAEKLSWRIVADHNLNLLAMAAPAVQREPVGVADALRQIAGWMDDGGPTYHEAELIGMAISGPVECSSAKQCTKAAKKAFLEAARIWEYMHQSQPAEQQPTRRKKPMSYPNGLDMEPMPGMVEMRVDGKESVIDSPLDTQLVEALERIIEAAPSGGPLWHGSKQITYARAALAAHRKQEGDV